MRTLSGAEVDCEGPNEYLYRFSGTLQIGSETIFPIDEKSVLLKGSTLRNTEWVIGVAVYTGHDTKIMKNSSESAVKHSKNSKALNYYVLFTMAIQLICSIVGSAILSIWTEYSG